LVLTVASGASLPTGLSRAMTPYLSASS
jgi:hypothetical protein